MVVSKIPKFYERAAAKHSTMTSTLRIVHNRFSAMILTLLVGVFCVGVGSAFAPFSTLKISAKKSHRLYSSSSSSTTTSRNGLPEGMTKTTVQEGRGPSLSVGDVALVRYTCSHLEGGGIFAKSMQQKVMLQNDKSGVMIPAWDMALATMSVGERSTFLVRDSELGYGPTGVPPIVPANAALKMDVEIINLVEQENAGVEEMSGMASDPSKPRTPGAIANAYKKRQATAAANAQPAKEGLQGMIEKFKTFYFFGFFEGETGQEAPWFLRPSITFPIAFLIVGLTFYVSFSFGGISERGTQIQDELDEIIITLQQQQDTDHWTNVPLLTCIALGLY